MSSDLIKIYSHPRSGTHFLEAVIAENFYSSLELQINEVVWGHWANRKTSLDPNKYGKLFGSHEYPSALPNIKKGIYIYRDPRAVAYSIWKTPNFINPKLQGISFSDFLRSKLDWVGSPAFQSRRKYSIIRHWEKHVKAWLKYANESRDIYVMKYEDLVEDTENTVKNVSYFFGIQPPLEIKKIIKPVGLLPNKAMIDSWKDVFSEKDQKFVKNKIRSKLLKELYF